MKTRLPALAVGIALCGLLPNATGAGAAPTRRDLVVELRQVTQGPAAREDGDNAAGYAVSTTPADGGFAPQQLRVQSGEKAVLRITQSTPMQWVQSAQSGSASLSAGGASATQNAAGVTQASTTLESGQTLVATPHWAGGNKPVRVELDWQTATLAERTGADLPTTTRHQFSSTLNLPLRQWVTIATSGANPPSGSYSSTQAGAPKRLLQLRVSPP